MKKAVTNDVLSIFEMALDDPTILKEGIGALIISQVDTFTCIPYNVSCSWVSSRTISHKLLQISNVIRRN